MNKYIIDLYIKRDLCVCFLDVLSYGPRFAIVLVETTTVV